MNPTTTIEEIIRRLGKFSSKTTVVKWGMITETVVGRPSAPDSKLGALIRWMRTIPPDTIVLQWYIRMVDDKKFHTLMEFGIYETLSSEYT